MLFPKKNLGIQNNYFSFNVFFLFFMYAVNIVKCPFTYSYWLNGRWFLQIVDIGNYIMRLEILKSGNPLHLLVKWGYFQHLKKISGGGGGVKIIFFFLENHSLSFHVLCYFQH